MKVLAGMIVYDRVMSTTKLWLRAWQNANKDNTKLVVVHNYDPPLIKSMTEEILKYKPDYYFPRLNKGMDIGAFRDVIHADCYEPWDILFWSTDDNIPMHKDFLKPFIQPFEENPKLGLVGNHWVKGSFYPNYKEGVSDHIRTTCFAIRGCVAERLKFPIQLNTKLACYNFEWRHKKLNMTEQVKSLGYEVLPVCKNFDRCWTDCNEHVWDVGWLNTTNPDPRCRKDCWSEYYRQFKREITNDRDCNKVS